MLTWPSVNLLILMAAGVSLMLLGTRALIAGPGRPGSAAGALRVGQYATAVAVAVPVVYAVTRFGWLLGVPVGISDPGVTMAGQPAADASPPRRLTVVPPHPDTPAPPLLPADTGQTHTRDTDDGNKVALVHAAYAADDLTAEQATEMIAALPGREETTVEYGWRPTWSSPGW